MKTMEEIRTEMYKKRPHQMDSMELLEEFKAATIMLHEHPDSAKAQKRFQDVELEIYIRMNYREK